MVYSISQLSNIAGVSIRTLHYYDEIGLLAPSFVKENGYRYYEEKELLKLQQILLFRELEFPLDEIAQVVNDPNFDLLTALAKHRKLLALKQSRLAKLLKTIDKTILKVKGETNMKNDDLFAAFKDEEMAAEAEKRWGNTQAYAQSQKRIKNLKPEDLKKLKVDGQEFLRVLSVTMVKGIESSEVQRMIDQYYASMGTFFDCSIELFDQISEGYVTDPKFKASFEQIKPGFAQEMREAIAYYCKQVTTNQ